MDPLIPRKPQDVDRMPDHDHEPAPADVATGPDDRWANEAARSDPDYPAPDPDGVKEPSSDDREP